MKYKIHVPVAQYGFIEAEIEAEDSIEAVVVYNNIQNSFNSPKVENNLNRKEWNGVLDRYLQENKIFSEDYEKLSNDERIILNEIKKSLKRTSGKE